MGVNSRRFLQRVEKALKFNLVTFEDLLHFLAEFGTALNQMITLDSKVLMPNRVKKMFKQFDVRFVGIESSRKLFRK